MIKTKTILQPVVNLTLSLMAIAIATPLLCPPAIAWIHAGGESWSASGFRGTASGDDGSWSATGYRGGTASGSDGSWSATGFRGTTASGDDGSWNVDGYRGGTASGDDGSWSATGYRGGTASGGDGYWQGTSAYGTSVYGGDNRYYGGTYATYHPPTVVNTYGAGCYNCGGWSAAGAAATGAVIGAATATAVTNNAYTEGYTAGATAATTAYAMGAIYPTLPAGAIVQTIGNATYYLYNGVWFSPAYGANGVYYRVVSAPF